MGGPRKRAERMLRLLCLLGVLGASGIAPTGNPTATFMQGRVNLPHAMYNKGYYVTGTFQGTQNFGQIEKCDRTGEFCRIVSKMVLTSRGGRTRSSPTMISTTSPNGLSRWGVTARTRDALLLWTP